MKRIIIAAVCAALTVTTTVALAKNSETIFNFFNFNAQAQIVEQQPAETSNVTAQNTVPNAPAPDYATFDMLFNLVHTFDEAAAKLESQGKSGKIWSEYIERHANLNKQQIALLRQVADEFNRGVEQTHKQAMQIIADRQAARANGQPATPPPQLAALQLQRQAIALRHRDRLQTLVGAEILERLRHVLAPSANSSVQSFNPADSQTFEEGEPK